jgi:nitrogen regulatory protein P-II 1
MKRIEAIIRPGKLADVTEALEKLDCPGIMISEIEGHGRQGGIDQTLRGKKYHIGMMIKTKIDIIAGEGEVKGIVKAILSAAQTDKKGDGKIFIYPVENAIRIRTGEQGAAAI